MKEPAAVPGHIFQGEREILEYNCERMIHVAKNAMAPEHPDEKKCSSQSQATMMHQISNQRGTVGHPFLLFLPLWALTSAMA